MGLIIPSIVTQGDIYLRRYNSCKNQLKKLNSGSAYLGLVMLVVYSRRKENV